MGWPCPAPECPAGVHSGATAHRRVAAARRAARSPRQRRDRPRRFVREQHHDVLPLITPHRRHGLSISSSKLRRRYIACDEAREMSPAFVTPMAAQVVKKLPEGE